LAQKESVVNNGHLLRQPFHEVPGFFFLPEKTKVHLLCNYLGASLGRVMLEAPKWPCESHWAAVEGWVSSLNPITRKSLSKANTKCVRDAQVVLQIKDFNKQLETQLEIEWSDDHQLVFAADNNFGLSNVSLCFYKDSLLRAISVQKNLSLPAAKLILMLVYNEVHDVAAVAGAVKECMQGGNILVFLHVNAAKYNEGYPRVVYHSAMQTFILTYPRM